MRDGSTRLSSYKQDLHLVYKLLDAKDLAIQMLIELSGFIFVDRYIYACVCDWCMCVRVCMVCVNGWLLGEHKRFDQEGTVNNN